MIANRWTLVAMFALIVLPNLGSAQGTLDSVRRDVRQSAPREAPSRPAYELSDDEDEDSLGSVFGELLGQLLLLPFQAVYEHNAELPPMSFLDYPYQGKFPGYLSKSLLSSEEYSNTWKDRIHQSPWFGRISIDDGFDFNNRVSRSTGSILLDTSDRWGFQTTWSVLAERQPCGCIDTLGLGSTNITYRYLESRRLMLRAGLGANTLIDRQGDNWGFNFHLDSDWFLKRPFIASSVFDVGTLGSSTLMHVRGTVGVNYRGWEMFGGYDWLRIGSTDIHGPLVGIRLWF